MITFPYSSGCVADLLVVTRFSGLAATAPPSSVMNSRRFMCGWPLPGKRSFGVQHRGRLQSCVDGPCLARDHLACSTEVACSHVWLAPAWQEIIWRAAQRSLAVMCPACWCSPGGLLALMGCANRVLIIQTGSMSQ